MQKTSQTQYEKIFVKDRSDFLSNFEDIKSPEKKSKLVFIYSNGSNFSTSWKETVKLFSKTSPTEISVAWNSNTSSGCDKLSYSANFR